MLFSALMLGNISQGIAFTAFVAALPQMAHDLGPHGDVIAQMTLAVTALGLTIGSLLSGWVFEKGGTRGTMLTSLLAFGIAGGAGLVSHEPTLLLTSRFIVGFASACMVTACVWGIAAEYEDARRAKTLGAAVALGSLSSVAGLLIGGFITQHTNWSLTFIQLPLFSLVGWMIAFAGMRQVVPGREIVAAAAQPFFIRLLPFYVLAVLLFAIMFMATTQFSFVLEADGVSDAGTRSVILSMVTLISALISFMYGALQLRLGVRGALAAGLLSNTIALGMIGASGNPVLATVGAALMGVYIGLAVPYLYHSITEHTTGNTRSRAIGVLTAFCFFGGFLNTPIFVALSHSIGLRNTFLLASLVMGMLTLGTLIGIARKRSAAAPGLATRPAEDSAP
jgi:MFS family permease